MEQTKFNLNLWPYAITATAIFAIFKWNDIIDWSWFKVLLPVIVFKVLLPVIVLLVLTVVASLAIIALSLYKVKRDFKKTLEEQLKTAEQQSADRIALAEKYRDACEEMNKNWAQLSPEARTALLKRIRTLREQMNTAERAAARAAALSPEDYKQIKDSLRLPDEMKIVQTDAAVSGELYPVENPDAAMYEFVKEQHEILKENGL